MPITEDITHTFKHSWEDISLASWKKYPSENRPDVLSVDLIDRHFDPETGILTSTRLVIMQDKLPRFLQSVFGANKCICVEYSTVDPIAKTMTLRSQNISYQNVVKIEESCVYTVNSENPGWTDLKQEAIVHAYPFGVANSIEKFLANKFVTNAPIGRQIMENTVLRVEEDNILRKTCSMLMKETRDCAANFEKRFDTFKENLTLKVKETENELSEFYNDCKRASSEWTKERMNEVEQFLDEKFDTLFINVPSIEGHDDGHHAAAHGKVKYVRTEVGERPTLAQAEETEEDDE